jgi:hypothetical protein
MNRPTKIAYWLLISTIADPTHTTMFVNRIAFHLPIFAIGPENKAPTADPRVQREVIIVTQVLALVLSRTMHPLAVSVVKLYQPNIPEKGS